MRYSSLLYKAFRFFRQMSNVDADYYLHYYIQRFYACLAKIVFGDMKILLMSEFINL
jgi:hypothetical protein